MPHHLEQFGVESASAVAEHKTRGGRYVCPSSYSGTCLSVYRSAWPEPNSRPMMRSMSSTCAASMMPALSAFHDRTAWIRSLCRPLSQQLDQLVQQYGRLPGTGASSAAADRQTAGLGGGAQLLNLLLAQAATCSKAAAPATRAAARDMRSRR